MMTDWISRVEDAIVWAILSLVSASAAGGIWLVRRVFTNQVEIGALRAEIKGREQWRARDREDVQELKAKVDALHSMLLTFLARKDDE